MGCSGSDVHAACELFVLATALTEHKDKGTTIKPKSNCTLHGYCFFFYSVCVLVFTHGAHSASSYCNQYRCPVVSFISLYVHATSFTNTPAFSGCYFILFVSQKASEKCTILSVVLLSKLYVAFCLFSTDVIVVSATLLPLWSR